MPAVDFAHPGLLLLLPLALLPLLSSQRETLPFPWLDWIPDDALGKRLHTLWWMTAVATLALLIIGLAGPQRSEVLLERIGRGAEISILLDRSASMDSYTRRASFQAGDEAKASSSKNAVARGALSWLIAQRPENRYALTLFSVVPMRVVEFTTDTTVIQAGLDASAIGRGPKETNMGLALLAAIEAFNERPYTGSRVVILVSDGGAKLDEETRRKIQRGMELNKISLYFIHVQSGINTVNLELVGTDTESQSEEVALHLFFKELGTEYQVFQADDEASMAESVALIDQQQNLPLSYFERVPGIDYSRFVYALAILGCLILCVIATLRMGHFDEA